MKKVTEENIDTIKKGDTIVNYPFKGDPVNEFNKNDKENILSYSIKEIHDISQQYELLPEISGYKDLMYTYEIGPLHKSRQSLIDDNKWWIE